MNWETLGLKVDGEYLNNLRFADDVALFATSTNDLSKMIKDLEKSCTKAGLKMNADKTKLMSKGEQTGIFIYNKQIEYVEDYIYLGQLISLENQEDKEIDRRITNSWKQFWKHKHIFDANLTDNSKKYLFDATILPVMTYGSQTWNLSSRSRQKLEVTQRAMERSTLKVSRRQRIRNTIIRERTKFTDVITRAKHQKWNWAGHVARLNDNRWTLKSTQWVPRDKKRRTGRQLKRWRDDICQLNTSWQQIARDKLAWKALGEAYIRI